MNIGWALFCLFVAGAVGGVANTIITQHGFHIPRRETLADGGDIWRPGVLGDIFIGGLGGALLVVLNTPLGAMAVIGGTGEPATFGLTVGNLASSALVGVGGCDREAV